MNRHVPSSVLRVAFGCAIWAAAVTGQTALPQPAFAQEASEQKAPVVASERKASVTPPGIPARKPPVPAATAFPTPPALTADPRAPLNVPPNPGLTARPLRPGGRPVSPPPGLQPGVQPDLTTSPIPKAPTDRPNVPPPEGVQLGTPVMPPTPPGEPPVIAAVPGLPGERTPAVMPPQQATPAAPLPALGNLPTGTEFRVVFPDETAQTLSPADTSLLNGIAGRLRHEENARLQVLGYASGTPETNRESRRLSLERALAVRSYLIDQGVRATRIDIRALGSTAPQGPADRVDLLLVN